MTADEFVIWMKGFAQAANGYNITPKQWDDVKEQLERVKKDPIRGSRYTLDDSNWKVNTTADIKSNTVSYNTDSSTDTVF